MALANRVASAFRRMGTGLSQLPGALRGLRVLLVGGGMLALVAAGVIFLLAPELASSTLTLVALGVLLLLVALLSAPGQVRTALLGRRGRYGSNTALMVIAFTGIVIAANFLGVKQSYRVDLTINREFTLSPKTIAVLQDLTAPVQAVAFLTPGDPTLEATVNLLREYSNRSAGFSHRVVDPEANPALARQYEVTQYGTIVFESEGRRASAASQIQLDIPGRGTQVAPNPTLEQDITAAILKATGLKQKKVYFLTGHGEANIYDTQDQRGFGLAAQALIPDNYQVATLSLATVEGVPEDAAALIAAGPRQDLLAQEVPLLTDYLRRQGKLLLLADPSTPGSWSELLAPWGLALSDGRVIDKVSYAFPDTASPAVQRTQYSLGPVTKVLDTTFFPDARAVDVFFLATQEGREQTNVQTVDVALTTGSSWLETDTGDPKFDEGKDTPGPLVLAVLVEAVAPLGERLPAGQVPEKRTRLVVVGDSDFASNQFFYSLGNSDLFINSVNWLTEEEALISIRPKPFAFRRLVVTQRAWNWILYSSIAFLPLLVVVGGGVAWWRRR